MATVNYSQSLILRAYPTNTDKPTSDAVLEFASKDSPHSVKRAVLANCCTWSKANANDKYWKATFNPDLPPLISYKDSEGKVHAYSYTLSIDDCKEGWKVLDIQYSNGNSIFHRFDVVDELFSAIGGVQ